MCDQIQPITLGNVLKNTYFAMQIKVRGLWSLFLVFVAYYVAVFEANGQQISILMFIYFLQDIYTPL
jgi:hypothetical protein